MVPMVSDEQCSDALKEMKNPQGDIPVVCNKFMTWLLGFVNMKLGLD